jgi:UDP-N-acetyl-D-mannosaminuronic acid dehydrogenase
MAFKGGSDDPRESLAYKLRKILMLKTRETLCTDPYVVDDRFTPYDEVLKRSDLLVIAAPHMDYATVDTDKPVVDMWGLTGQGVRV